ncbi:MAG: hypothetical protein QOJ14_1797 [Thermoleophilaceae bacterium]|nr:hypothetical protein [Thermoleophilaceae bacterium]
MVAVSVAATPAQARPGDLDRSFGGGVVDILPGEAPYGEDGTAIARQPDGRVVVAGTAALHGGEAIALVRLRRGGRPDKGFGNGGIVLTQLSTSGGGASAVALQRDGRIVVTGTTSDNAANRQYLVTARYLKDGRLDESFGQHGSVLALPGGNNGYGRDVIVQPNGRILVGSGDTSTGWTLVRYLADGRPDESFGDHGVSLLNAGGQFLSMARRRDGRVNLAGGSVGYPAQVARIGAGGRLDKTFGDGGLARVPTPLRATTFAADLALQRDGKLVVAGYQTGTRDRMAVWRFGVGGRIDKRYGAAGVRFVPPVPGSKPFNAPSDAGLGVTLQRNGKAIAVGRNLGGNYGQPAQFIVARIGRGGKLDDRFGRHGRVVTTLPFHVTGTANSAVVQPNGRILVGGYGPGDGAGHILVARYRGGFGSR